MKQKVLYVLIVITILGAQMGMSAQNIGNQKNGLTPAQRIEKQTAHVVNSLSLNDATAAKFSKVYSQYLKELYDCVQQGCHISFGGKMDRAKMTDAQIDQMLQNRFDRSRKILNIREKYYKRFKQVLKPRQIWKVYSIEKANGSKMKSELNRRKGNGWSR